MPTVTLEHTRTGLIDEKRRSKEPLLTR
jgi:hypothetical protein